MRTIDRGLAAALLALAAGGAHAAPGTETCLPYAPAEATISGTLGAETYAGPPNYDSIEHGDLPQTAFFLALDKPVCVSGGGDSGNPAAPERHVEKIRISLPAGGALRKRMRLLMDKVAVARGTLTHAASTRDRAAVVMELVGVEPGPGVVMEPPKKPPSDKPPKPKK